MRRVLSATFLVVLLGSAQPAVAAGSSMEYRVVSGFLGNKTSLTVKQKATITSFGQIDDVHSISCVSYTKRKPSTAERNIALARAKATCNAVSRSQPMARQITTAVAVGQGGQLGTVRVAFSISVPDPVVAIPEAPNPFLKPFPVDFTKKQLIESALKALRSYVDKQTTSTTIEVVYQDTVPASERSWMDSMVSFLQKSFPLDDPSHRPLLVIGSSDDFIATEALKRGLTLHPPGFCGRITTYESYCASLGWAGLNYKDSIEKKYPIIESGKRSVLAHEYFHVWHKAVDGSTGPNNRDPRSPEGLPLWFAEGNANFFGFALTELAGLTRYAEGRATQVDEYMNRTPEQLASHISWDMNPYGIGQASAEYLVASVGVEKVLEVYRKSGRGTLFAEAFESSIGIPLADYYRMFEAARASMLK